MFDICGCVGWVCAAAAAICSIINFRGVFVYVIYVQMLVYAVRYTSVDF